jgi:DNA-binding transcriptional MerR regulator
MITGIPDKHYLRIGEVSAITGLPASVLRFWETEFASLSIKKSSSGQRLYTKKDVELIADIKELLYTEKLTIEGARKRLEGKKKYRKTDLSGDPLATLLQEVKQELTSLRDQL